MKIGYFTETYLPSTDGVVSSIESFRKELEALGHEVYIFAPKPHRGYKETNPRVVRFPAVKSFFDNRVTGIFFPPRAVKKVEEYNLEIIHFHYPAPIGLLGAYVATKDNIPLVTTWHTNLYGIIEHYPTAFPGIMALSLVAPIVISGGAKEYQKAISMMKPESNIDTWNKKMISSMATVVHNRCDLVIAPSLKIKKELFSWGTTARIEVLPTGVDKLPVDDNLTKKYQRKFNIKDDAPVILFVGRLGKEKNIKILLDAFHIVLESFPRAQLVLAGDNKHKKELLERIEELGLDKNVILTGYIEHQHLGSLYALADIFAFPSVVETQGLVLNEAAHAGLPLVVIDNEVTNVLQDGVNGILADNTPTSFAAAITTILRDAKLQKAMGQASSKIAQEYSAAHQAKLLEGLYQEIVS